MRIIDFAKVNTKPKTIFIEIVDATIGILLLGTFVVMVAGILYMLK